MGNLTSEAYSHLINGDIKWLLLQPRTLEREHIIDVLESSAKAYESAKQEQRSGVDELAEDFDQEQSRNALTDDARELLKNPLIQSLLYDLNLLPEQITKYKHWYYMLAVIAHMGKAIESTPVLVKVREKAKEMTQVCRADWVDVGRPYEPKDYRDMAHEILRLIDAMGGGV